MAVGADFGACSILFRKLSSIVGQLFSMDISLLVKRDHDCELYNIVARNTELYSNRVVSNV